MKRNWDNKVKPKVYKKFKQMGFPPSYYQYQHRRQNDDDDDDDMAPEPIRLTKPKPITNTIKKENKTKKRRISRFIESDEEEEEDDDEDEEESFHSSDDEVPSVTAKSGTEKSSNRSSPVKRKAAAATVFNDKKEIDDDDDEGEDDSDYDHMYKKKKKRMQTIHQQKNIASSSPNRPPMTADKASSIVSADSSMRRAIDLELLEANLRAAWEEISALDPNLWFGLPVTDAVAPGYSKEIKSPMDMSTIIKRVNAHYYKSVEDFDKDMNLMVNNCEKFNGIQDLLTKLAKKMLKAWQKDKKRIENECLLTTTTSIKSSNDVSANGKPQAIIPIHSATSDTALSTSIGSIAPSAAAAVTSVAATSREYSKEELPDILSDCLQWLTDHDSLGLFAYPADSLSLHADAKMDLSTIRIKVERVKYRNTSSATAIDGIDSDVQNMVKSVLSLCTELAKREVRAIKILHTDNYVNTDYTCHI